MPDIDSLVPHRGRMCLISRVEELSPESIVIAADIAPDHIFMVEGRGVPAYVGLEMMAQTICAFDGMSRWRDGGEPAIGFLLGCQRYRTWGDWFAAGEPLRIRATCMLDGGDMGSFDCEVTDAAGDKRAAGMLNVFRPSDPQAFLRSGTVAP